jgi:hypothetical protein
MIDRTTRPLTADERRRLTMKPTGPVEGAFVLGMFILLPLIAVFSLLCWYVPSLNRLERSPWAVPFFLAPSLYFGARAYLKEKRYRIQQDRDLDSRIADVTTYHVKQAIKVEECEDLGIGFYLDLGEGKVLYLQGQYLYKYSDDKRFPCTRFTISRTTHSRKFLDIRCEGEYIAPVCVNPPFTKKDGRAGLVPKDGQILEIDFERLKKR